MSAFVPVLVIVPLLLARRRSTPATIAALPGQSPMHMSIMPMLLMMLMLLLLLVLVLVLVLLLMLRFCKGGRCCESRVDGGSHGRVRITGMAPALRGRRARLAAALLKLHHGKPNKLLVVLDCRELSRLLQRRRCALSRPCSLVQAPPGCNLLLQLEMLLCALACTPRAFGNTKAHAVVVVVVILSIARMHCNVPVGCSRAGRAVSRGRHRAWRRRPQRTPRPRPRPRPRIG